MPYMTKMNGDKHCVYKKGTDDQPEGESMGCHDTAEEAQAQVDALYAQDEKMPMMETVQEQIIFEHVSRFKKEYPDVPLSSELDPLEFDENTRFVTLPLMPIGAKSRNGRTYSEQVVRSIVDQINQKRPEGRWGHLAEQERSTRYDPPALRWVGAMLDADGLAWGKAIPVTESAREHIMTAKKTRAHIGTSIYGSATLKGSEVIALELESIDLADPARVGIQEAAAVPIVEMTDETKENETVNDELIQEMDGYKAQIAELTQERDTRQALIAELLSVAGVEKADDLKAVVSELITTRNAAIETARKAVAAKVIGETLKELPDTALLVSELLGVPDSDDETTVKARVAELLQAPHVKPAAENERVRRGGPRAIVGNETPQQGIKDTPEAREAAKQRMGMH